MKVEITTGVALPGIRLKDMKTHVIYEHKQPRPGYENQFMIKSHNGKFIAYNGNLVCFDTLQDAVNSGWDEFDWTESSKKIMLSN